MKKQYEIEFPKQAAFNQDFHENLDFQLERARQWGFERGFHAGWKAAIEHVTALLQSEGQMAQLTDLIHRMPVHGMPESDSAWCATEVLKHIKHRIEMEAA